MIGFLLKTLMGITAFFAIIAVIVAIPWLFFVGVAFACLSVIANWS